MDAVGLVELHDAILTGIVIQPGDFVRMSFSQVSVYVKESADTYGVWSFEATILCDGVRDVAVQLKFPLDVADAVESCEISDAEGQVTEPSKLTEGIANGQLRLRWCLSSNALSCEAQRITVRLDRKVERVETWSGPLAPDG